jgi:hypothetical protein
MLATWLFPARFQSWRGFDRPEDDIPEESSGAADGQDEGKNNMSLKQKPSCKCRKKTARALTCCHRRPVECKCKFGHLPDFITIFHLAAAVSSRGLFHCMQGWQSCATRSVLPAIAVA